MLLLKLSSFLQIVLHIILSFRYLKDSIARDIFRLPVGFGCLPSTPINRILYHNSNLRRLHPCQCILRNPLIACMPKNQQNRYHPKMLNRMEERKSSYHRHLQIGLEAVWRGCYIGNRLQKSIRDSDTFLKEDSSPVTVADFTIQALISLCITHSATPDIPILLLAEEDCSNVPPNALIQLVQYVNDAMTGAADGCNANNHALGESCNANKNALDADTILAICQASHCSTPSRLSSTTGYWVLDPIDGTKGFLRGEQYAIALGFVDPTGQPVLGILGCPNLPHSLDNPEGPRGVLFYAIRGQGAYKVFFRDLTHIGMHPGSMDAHDDTDRLRLHTGSLFVHDNKDRLGLHMDSMDDILSIGKAFPFCKHVERIRVNSVFDPENVLLLESYEAMHSDQSFSKQVVNAIGSNKREPFRVDSQVKYGLVASGYGNLLLRFPGTHYEECVWDHCAGSVILLESGGAISHADGEKLDFKGRFKLKNTSGIVVTCNQLLHELVLDTIKKLRHSSS